MGYLDFMMVSHGVIHLTIAIKGKVILVVPSFLQRHVHCSETSTHKKNTSANLHPFLELLRGTIKSNIKTSFGLLSGFPLHEINISILATVNLQQSSSCHPVSKYRDVLSGLKPRLILHCVQGPTGIGTVGRISLLILLDTWLAAF